MMAHKHRKMTMACTLYPLLSSTSFFSFPFSPPPSLGSKPKITSNKLQSFHFYAFCFFPSLSHSLLFHFLSQQRALSLCINSLILSPWFLPFSSFCSPYLIPLVVLPLSSYPSPFLYSSSPLGNSGLPSVNYSSGAISSTS